MHTPTRSILTISVISVGLIMGCNSCEPKNNPTWNPEVIVPYDGGTGSSSGSHGGSSSGGTLVRHAGPGRPTEIRDIVTNATRVRSPAFDSTLLHSQDYSTITQGLNGDDGGRNLSVNFTGTNVSFQNLYFALGPLQKNRIIHDDAGNAEGILDVIFPAVIIKVLATGGTEEVYAFESAEDQEMFRSGFGGQVVVDGLQYDEPRNLVLSTVTGPDETVYFASNGSREILAFSPQFIRTTFLHLDAPVGDIKIKDGWLFASLLPVLTPDTQTLLRPPAVIKIPLGGGAPETVCVLPADLASYQSNVKQFEVSDGDGGISERFSAPTSISFSLAIGFENEVYVTSSFENKVYRANISDAGYAVTEYASGLEGITSLSKSPVSDCLYATLPAVVIDQTHVDAGTPWAYERYPRIISLCNMATADVLSLTSYAAIDPLEALHGFGNNFNNRIVAFAELHTIAVDSNGNLILADPIRSTVTAIHMVYDEDGGMADAGP